MADLPTAPAANAEDALENVVPLELDSSFPFVCFPKGRVVMARKRMRGKDEIEEQVTVCSSDFRIVGWAEGKNTQLRICRVFNELLRKNEYFALPTDQIGFADGWKLLQGRGVKADPNPKLRQLFSAYLMEDTLFLENGVRDGRLDKYEVLTQTGWTKDRNTYVFADGDANFRAGQDASRTIVDLQKSGSICDVQQSGTKEDWCKHVAPLLKGNDFLTLSVAVSLAGAMLPQLNARGFGIHLYGGTSKGKTTTSYIANSIWGDPLKRVISWDMTPLALGILASIHNHSLLSLDEVKQAKGKELVRAIYGMFNGQLRIQGEKEGGLRDQLTWNTMMLSNGELTVDQHIRLILKEDVDAGVLVRLLNIYYQEPVNLHGSPTGKAFAERLLAVTSKYHGAFGRWWVQQIMDNEDAVQLQYSDAVERWSGITDQYQQGSFSRVGNHFALLEAALILASKHLDQSVDEIRALMERLFKVWLDGFTSDTGMSHEESMVVERAKIVLQQYQRFAPANLEKSAQEPHGEIYGLKDNSYFYVYPNIFAEHIAGNMNPIDAARTLEKAEMMIPMERSNGKKAYKNGFVRARQGDHDKTVTYRMKLARAEED